MCQPRVRTRHSGRQGGQTAAVTDILGSILLVGVTVLMATGLGFLILSFKGPTATTQASVSMSVDPGQGGWGTGDERIVFLHRGGEPLNAADTTIVYQVNSNSQVRVTGNGLVAGGFANGKLHIGQTWSVPMTLAATDDVRMGVLSKATGGNSLLASADVIPGRAAAASNCPLDVSAPTVATWAQVPADVKVSTTGQVNITATLQDDCSGPDTAPAPHLFWRVNPGTNPAYTDQGAMVSLSSTQWKGIVPSQGWSGFSGRVLEYYISPVTDLRGNTGASAFRQDTIQPDCSSDTVGPTVANWTQTPGNVRTNTVGTIQVVATLTDNCAGPDDSKAPELWYRVNNGTNPAPIKAATMTINGLHQWRATIPDAGWAASLGKTLEYRVQGMTDLLNNTSTSPYQQDVIESPYTYVTCPLVGLVGTVTTCTALQVADATTGTIAEIGQTSSLRAPASATGTGSVTTPNLAVSSDNQWAVITATGGTVDATGFTLPGGATAITKVVIGFEGAQVSNGGTAPQALLSYKVGSTAGATTQASTVSNTADAQFTVDVTADRDWALADVTNLHVLVAGTIANRNLQVDQAYATVTYVGAGGSTFTMKMELDWSAVPSGTTQTLELNYKLSTATGDTFNVQVWTGSAWRTCAGTLAGTTQTTFSCALTLPGEYASGSPRVRIVDLNPAGTTSTSILVDYARVVTS